jgi:Flp pilus assembly protein TadD
LQQNLKDRPQALQRYREYLALTPRPPDWEAVQATTRALEQEIARVATPPPTNVVAQVSTPEPAVTKPATSAPPKSVVAAKPEPTPRAEKPSPAVAAKPTPPPPAPSLLPPTQTVAVVAPPEIKAEPKSPPPSPTPAVPAVTTPPPTNRVAPLEVTVAAPPSGETEPPQKRSLLQRMNPVNLFRRDSKPEPRLTPLPGQRAPVTNAPEVASAKVVASPAPPPVNVEPRVAAPPTKPVPRYAYRRPPSPAPGNRSEAEAIFARGVVAQRESKLLEAIRAYQAATQADPAYFEAYYNLGLAAMQAGDLPQSLAAYESALAVTPDSRDARYNFALGLKEAGYLLDAAAELERLVTRHANDSRARVALANLYAQQLRQPAQARAQYQKVLEIEPRHPQADTIRFWLMQNPE